MPLNYGDPPRCRLPVTPPRRGLDDYTALREAINECEGMRFWTNDTDRVDTTYWKKDPGDNGDMRLKPGARPDIAIHDCGPLGLECREYVAFIVLKLMLKRYGGAHVNRFFAPNPLQNVPLTTPDDMLEALVDYRVIWNGNNSAYEIKYLDRWGRRGGNPALVIPQTPTFDTMIWLAPIGSRVCFTNMNAGPTCAFRNQNTVKVGNDEFTALGVGDPPRIYSSGNICDELGRYTPEYGTDQVIAITMIEHYNLSKAR